MKKVVVTGSFDSLRSRHIRFLEEASRLGKLHALIWSDASILALENIEPEFPQEERLYLVQAISYVDRAKLVNVDTKPGLMSCIEEASPTVWVVHRGVGFREERSFCHSRGIEYRILPEEDLDGFPISQHGLAQRENRRKVIVTGCFDWFHSGHVRFFEEVSELGDLYVVVGHDDNVRLLKGKGHPMFSQDERRYMVHAIRYVKQALISTGHGWLDAEPEIERIKPDIYAVNEDGDKPEKREFCRQHGLEYVVLKRAPKEGLPRRTSTSLRGF
jgi:cytidyltransferase-like protein